MGDQEIGTDPHDLPTDKQHEQVATHHQQNHGTGKQRDDRKETIVTGIPDHVSGRVDVNDAADPCDQNQQEDGKLVDIQTKVDDEISGLHESVERN